MSVRKNIPQHPGVPSSKVVDLAWVYRPVVQVALPLDREWWPASRQRPTDGRSPIRVVRQHLSALRARMMRERGEGVEF